jgi:quercetin dioxygenase-like cupin family protein
MMQKNNFQSVEYGQEVSGVQIFPGFINPDIATKIGALAKSFFEQHPEEPYASQLSSLVGSICVKSQVPDELSIIPINKEHAEDPLVTQLDVVIPVIDSTTRTTKTSFIHRYKKGAFLNLHKDKPETIRSISLLGEGALIIPDNEPILLTPGTMFHTSEDAIHGVRNISEERFSLCLTDDKNRIS